jgi:group I intron endonuclease
VHHIYKITNLVNDCIYIGYTSRSCSFRWIEHIRETRKCKTSRQLITKAIVKYGAENFVMEELTEVETQEEALLLEIKYIAEFRSNRNHYPEGNGYNLHDGGNVPPAQKGKTWKKSGIKRHYCR